MRRPTTLLLVIAVVVIAVALALRSDGGRTDDDTTSTLDTTTSTVEEAGDTGATATVDEPDPGSTSTTAALPADGPVCALYADIVVTGRIQSPDLVETSGMAASRSTDGILWAHNDSRGGAALHAFDAAGTDLGAFEIPDAFALDWEDMGAGPDAAGEGRYLYVGDIGDNFSIRDGIVTVWRVDDTDPSTLDGAFPAAVPLGYRLPDGPYDAEALFIDPIDPAIYLITKSRSEAFVFRGPLTASDEPHDMELVATLFLDAEVSGADMSHDGRVIALRGYDTVWMWTRQPGQSVGEALAADPCTAPSPDERQGESIAFDASLGYFTVSEGTTPDINYVAADR